MKKRSKKNSYISIPHNPKLPIMVASHRLWYPCVKYSQEDWTTGKSKAVYVAVGDGHIVRSSTESACGQNFSRLLDEAQENRDKYLKGEEAEEVSAKVFDRAISSKMCKQCSNIYKDMPDWQNWKASVDSYQSPEDNHAIKEKPEKTGKKNSKQKGQQAKRNGKPANKPDKSKTRAKTAERSRTNNKVHATKGKKRL